MAESGAGSEPLTAEQKQSFLDHAQCMRDRGWDMPDPTFDGGRVESEFRRGAEAGAGDPAPDDPQFEKDMQECLVEAGVEAPDGSTRRAGEVTTPRRASPAWPVALVVLAGRVRRARRARADPSASPPRGPPGRSHGPTSCRPRRRAARSATARRPPSPARVPGTLTWLAPVGSTVANGQPVYAVDARPVVRLPGAVPAWRDLGPSSADGIDVRQLEQALTDLGHTAGLDLTVDEDWTSVTTRRRQAVAEVAGRRADGHGPARRRDVHAAGRARRRAPGRPRRARRARRAGARRRRDAAGRHRRAADQPGRSGTGRRRPRPSTLPDGTTTAGTITATAVVTVDEQPQLRVTITPADALVDGLAEGTPVEVGLDQTVATDVLVVPVTALVALADGGYGVQKVLADGTSQYVTVTTGAFAGTSVEVSGDDVAEGDEVVVSP